MDSFEIEETAAAWLTRRESDAWSEADEANLKAWLHASTAHRVAFIRLEAAWRQANRLKALGAGIPRGEVPTPGEWRQSPFFDTRGDRARSGADAGTAARADRLTRSPVGEDARPRTKDRARAARREERSRWVARSRVVAASVVLTFAFGIGWYFWPAGPAYETSVGGVEAVALSDGSNVTLNTNSEIRVALTDTERHIELMRGEAFFDVAKDPARPFVVLAGGQRVVAVGTKFSVRRAERRADEVRVVVTEGRVRVGPVAGVAPELPPAEVAAGSIARAGGAGVLIEEQPARPVDEYLSWRSGYLVFRATALADAVAEFNRYNTTKLVIEDPAVAAIEIGGNFRSTNVDAFVRLLKDGFSIRVEQRGDEIVLTAARQ